jgi:hypothetical protein
LPRRSHRYSCACPTTRPRSKSAHELAHIFWGHLGLTTQGFWTDRHDTRHDAREIEAEVTAFFVTERMNLDIGSVSYLAGYTQPGHQLRISASTPC